ncbi:hypothetical protein B0H10DRAFT_2103225, partial [Mycena sp. CBHHK59/15]
MDTTHIIFVHYEDCTDEFAKIKANLHSPYIVGAYNAAPGLCQVQIPPLGGQMGTRYVPPDPAQCLWDAERWT